MKKSALVLTAFIVMVAASLAFTRADEPRYKNLKVLPRDINKQQMDSVMKSWAASLGVKCNFCHVFNQEQKAMDFANDNNKHKNIAREMFRMTAKINKKYFDVDDSKEVYADLEVTCQTCHNGKEHPSKKPVIPPPGGQQGGAPAGAQKQ